MTLELDELPDRPTAGLPDFLPDGILSEGDYAPSEKEFTDRFVTPTARRREIFAGWNRHRLALMRAGLDGATRQLLNGSYTTRKAEPGDLDLAVEVPVTPEDLQKESPIFTLLAGPANRSRFDCDAYPIFCLSKNDPLYEAVTVAAIRYWTKWFARTREGKVKGRVWARTGGLE